MSKQQESSLTTPEDRDILNKWKPNQTEEKLTEEEAEYALKDLNLTQFSDKYRSVDRTYADPAISLQNIGLISFYPSKGATPDKNGIFGFAKLRGNYATEIEASQRAEYLIRNIDSYHRIYHCHVGRPFPITDGTRNFAAVVDEVDLKKEAIKAVSENIKNKKDQELKEIREIQKREEDLLKESKKAQSGEVDIDPYENYIVLQVKKSQLTFTYLEHQKKMAEIKNIIIKTREELTKLNEEHPTFKDSYFEKYMKARKDAGITETMEETSGNFIKYMVEDVDLGF
jgi:hypothetical protein